MDSPSVFNRSTSRDLRETFWDSDEKVVGLSLQRSSSIPEKAFVNSPRASATEYFPAEKRADSSVMFVNIPNSSRRVTSSNSGASSDTCPSSPGKTKASRLSRLSRWLSFFKKGQIGVAVVVLLVLAVQVGWIYQPFGRIEFTIRLNANPTTSLLGHLGQLQQGALLMDGPKDIPTDAVSAHTKTGQSSANKAEAATQSTLTKFFKHTFPQRQCDFARGAKLQSEDALSADEFSSFKYLLILPRGNPREQFARMTRGLAWAKASGRKLVVIPPIPSEDEIWSEEHCWVEKALQKRLDMDWSDLVTLSDSDLQVPVADVVQHLRDVMPCLSNPADHSLVEARTLQYYGLRVEKSEAVTTPVTTTAFADWIKAGESQRLLCADFAARPDPQILMEIGSMIKFSPAIEAAADSFIAKNFGPGKPFLGLHVWRSEEFPRVCSDLKKCGRSMKQIYQAVRTALTSKDSVSSITSDYVYILTESQRSALDRMLGYGWKRYDDGGARSREPSPATEPSGEPSEAAEGPAEISSRPSGPGPYSHALVEVAVVTRASLFIADPDATLSLLVAGRCQGHGGRVAFLQPQKSR